MTVAAKMLRGGVVLVGIALTGSLLSEGAEAQDDNTWSTINRGLYLVRLADCAACHTKDPQRPFAGNYPLQTPFGTIYTSNLTPDPETGLGNWTEDDFYHALNKGRRPDGTRLYPAFPYTHFTLIRRDDANAIFAYLSSLKPIHQDVKPPDFPFPLNWRPILAVWNALNFEDTSFQPRPDRSAAWNRGYYIAEALGHCALCHSPKDVTGAVKTGSDAYTGGMAEGWFAPSLRAFGRGGLGDWSKEDIIVFLRSGRNDFTAAFGPMAEVVSKSTRHMTDSDLEALASYIKRLPYDDEAQPKPAERQPLAPADARMKTGKLVYEAQCAACHTSDGAGIPGQFARLAGSSLVQSTNPTTVIRAILEGVRSVVTDNYPTPHAMPAFNWKLSDPEIAAVATYIRNAFGNSAAAVSADDVARIRGQRTDLRSN